MTLRVSFVVENIIVVRLLQKESLFLKEILRGAAPFLRSADTTFETDDSINQKEERSMNLENDDYYSVARRKEVREESRKLRKMFLRYKEAEIVYSIQHKKLLELADAAGALYRIDGYVLINREVFEDYLEQFRQPPKTKAKAAPNVGRWKK